MTTNQTIDGVPRELLESFARDAAYSPNAIMRLRAEQARALLDSPAGDTEGDEVEKLIALCLQKDAVIAEMDRIYSELKAAQPQGEQVAWTEVDVSDFMSVALRHAEYSGLAPSDILDGLRYMAEKGKPAHVRAEQPAPVAVVPDGYCIMPRRLTAENGAKALLLGEFKLDVTKECPECCELEEPTEGCEICDGEGEYGQQYTISWDQIKFIYSKAVSGLAVKTESAKSR